MFDIDRWIEIWATITRNKTRSLLTCFGVFWGILMLVLLLGSGVGMKTGLLGNLEGFATNTVFFIADRTGEPYKGFNKGRYWYMRNRDVTAIKEEVEGIKHVSPFLTGGRSDKNVSFRLQTGMFSIKGILPEYFEIDAQNLQYGRLINEIDIQGKRKVCVIGTAVNEALFRDEDPCGKYIRVNGIYYQVVGVTNSKATGININGRTSESVFIPFSTLQQVTNQGDIIHLLFINILPEASVQRVLDDVTAVLKRQNEIAPSDPQAVNIINLAAQFATFNNLFTGIDILVWLVGMGTLLAGIIGVSNIMMVTIKERTKEIGVRRALGAKPFNIISQVMSESLVLTALAGLLGLSLGVFILDVVDRILMAQPAPADSGEVFFAHPSVSIQTAVAATVVLLLAGLLAGLIPAWRAMKIKAIDAIREE
ncbi:MAG: ABC transporter permease [Tannerellaceae bacterium]|jgi:putative ABC transport system permease protein|nr:ABC transporter permease [Tannerellaceae bacterium]